MIYQTECWTYNKPKAFYVTPLSHVHSSLLLIALQMWVTTLESVKSWFVLVCTSVGAIALVYLDLYLTKNIEQLPAEKNFLSGYASFN